jgi:hypothetical protein
MDWQQMSSVIPALYNVIRLRYNALYPSLYREDITYNALSGDRYMSKCVPPVVSAPSLADAGAVVTSRDISGGPLLPAKDGGR